MAFTGKNYKGYLTSKNIPTIEYFFSGNSTLCFYALNYNRKNIRHTARLLLLTRVQSYKRNFVLIKSNLILSSYRAFHWFEQAKFLVGGSVLGSSQFSILPQLPPKIMLFLKMVKINPRIIILLHKSKSMSHSVCYLF